MGPRGLEPLAVVALAGVGYALGRAISTRATPEAMEVAAEASPLFQRTVAELLSLVRPLSFH